MDFKTIQKLESIAGGSPFYVVDRPRFEANFDELTAAFAARYQPFILAYSYKTNYLPYLCNIVKHKGGWAEVVSRLEYDLALRIGHPPEKIIFNGPVKTADDIELALDNGSLINVDSPTELEWVAAYANEHPGREIPIGLRINVGLSDAAGRSHIQNSLKVGRFGLDPACLKAESRKLKAVSNLKIVSLHGHTSTTDRSQWCFEVITRTLCEIAESYFPDTVRYINIGGGFFGRMHPDMPFKDTPTCDDYAAVVGDVLNTHPWAAEHRPTLVIEPGVAMVADTVSFVTKVVSTKSIRDRMFVTVDGSAFHVKPTFHALTMPHQVITQYPRPSASFDVVGATCMEKDILLKDITAPQPQPGDYIVIDSIGAYTLVMTPPFIIPAPAAIADEGQGQFKLIRKKQTLEEIFSNYIF